MLSVRRVRDGQEIAPFPSASAMASRHWEDSGDRVDVPEEDVLQEIMDEEKGRIGGVSVVFLQLKRSGATPMMMENTR